MPTREESDDKTVQVAIYKALEWTEDEIAEVMGVSQPAINQRASRYRERIAQVMAWVNVAAAKYIEKRIVALETKADVKKRIHEKGYKLVEKTLDQGLKDAEKTTAPDGTVIDTPAVEVSMVHLRAADMAIERTEGKAVDHKRIESHSQRITVTVDGDRLERIFERADELNRRRIAAYQPPAHADVPEGDIVGPSN